MTDDLQGKRELADAARGLLEDKAFSQAISELRKRWYEELMGELTDAQQKEIIAMSKALRSIPDELTVLMNNYKIAAKRAHG